MFVKLMFFYLWIYFLAVQWISKIIRHQSSVQVLSWFCFYFCNFSFKYFLLMHLRKKGIEFCVSCWTNFIFVLLGFFFLHAVRLFYVHEYTFCLFILHVYTSLFTLQTCCLFILMGKGVSYFIFLLLFLLANWC